MENNTLTFYKQNGNAPIINLVLSIFSSSIIIFFLSYYYSLIITYFPLVYFNILLVCIFGYAIFLISNSFNKLFKIRNRKRALFVTMIVSIIAFYFQWICFYYIITSENVPLFINDWDYMINIVSSPLIMLEHIIEISKVGIWEMFGAIIKGNVLWFVWLLEFLLIVLMAFMAFKKNKTEPFANESNNWYNKNTVEDDFEAISLKKYFIEDFEKSPFEAINSLKLSFGTRYCKIHIYKSKGSKSLISIENILVTKQGKGNKELTTIIEPCYIDSIELKKIEDKFRIRKPKFFDFITEMYT